MLITHSQYTIEFQIDVGRPKTPIFNPRAHSFSYGNGVSGGMECLNILGESFLDSWWLEFEFGKGKWML